MLVRTSPRPENGAAGSAHSPQGAGPGRARPRAFSSRGSGLQAPTQGIAMARSGGRRATGTGAALTVAFVSAAHSGRSRSRRRLRGSCLPHARSCAPQHTSRFLAPPSSPKLARRRGERRGALREPREGHATAQPPPRWPRPLAARGTDSGTDSISGPSRRALDLRRLQGPIRGERRAESQAGARAGKDTPEDGDQGWVGARGSLSQPSGRRRLAPLPWTAQRGGACAPSGATDAPRRARLVLSLRTSLICWQLREGCPEIRRPRLFKKIINIWIVESIINWFRAENIHLAFEMCEIICLLGLRLLYLYILYIPKIRNKSVPLSISQHSTKMPASFQILECYRNVHLSPF